MSTDISNLSGSSGFDAAQQRRADERKSVDFNDMFKKQIDKKILEKKQLTQGETARAQGAEATKREAMARPGAAPGADSRRFEEALFAKLRGDEGEEKAVPEGEAKTQTQEAKTGDAKAPTEGKKTEAKGEAKTQEAPGGAAKEAGAKTAGPATGAKITGPPTGSKESLARTAEKGAHHTGVAAKSGKADGAAAKDADGARGAAGAEKAKEKEKQGAMPSALGPGAHHLAAADRKGKGDGGKGESDGKKDDLGKQVAQNLTAGAAPHPFALQAPTQAAPAQAAHKAQIPPEVVDKIVDRARFGMNAEGAHEFQIDLKQDVFKGLKLKVTTKDGKVNIEMIADNPEVQKTFEGKAGELAQALASRGLNVAGVHVGLAGDQRRDATSGGGGGKGGSGERPGAGGVSGVRRPGGPGRGGTGGPDAGPQSGKDYTA